MILSALVWDHKERDSKSGGILRKRLQQVMQCKLDSWDDGLRGCGMCAATAPTEESVAGPPPQAPACKCWERTSQDQRFVVWFHPDGVIHGPQDFDDWKGREGLIAVVRLTVNGPVRRVRPTLCGTPETPFLALHMRTPLIRVDTPSLAAAMHPLAAALIDACTGRDCLRGFRNSTALREYAAAAALWNANAPNPSYTFAWSVLVRNGKGPDAESRRKVWEGADPEVQDIPEDLRTLYESKAHRCLLRFSDINGVEPVANEWFSQNREVARAFGIVDTIWESERTRVAEHLRQLVRERLEGIQHLEA